MLRARHLACMFLLLSSLGAAQAATPRHDLGFRGTHIGALLYRSSIAARTDYSAANAPFVQSARSLQSTIPSEDRASIATSWTMRPPSAHSASVHAVTALAR